MRIRLTGSSRRITRQHLQGAAVAMIAVGSVVGLVAAATIEAKGEDLRWLGRRLVEKRRLLEDQRGQLARMVAVVSRVSESLEDTAAQLEKVAVTPGDESEIELALASDVTLRRDRGDVANAMQRLALASERLAALGHDATFASAVADSRGGPSRDVPSSWPVEGRVSSTFGMRVDPIHRGWRMHPGVDIKAASGTPVEASGAGLVLFAGYRSGYGKTVVVDHGDGLKTLYGHMSRLRTREGRRVGEGDVIGFVGSTGRSTGPHLHYEVLFRGEAVNPMCYLGRPPTRRQVASALTTPG